MVRIFHDFFNELRAEDIIFCNWKGHHQVNENLEGEGDLDIFTPLASKKKFEEIATEGGFKRVLSYQAEHPFIEHFYGFDVDTLKFVHLHVYFKIVTGEHISKNYMLPLENYLTRNLDFNFLLPTINENAKLNIFLIRYFLKIGSLFGLVQYFREREKYSNEWSSMVHTSNDDIIDLNLSNEILQEMKTTYLSSSPLSKLILSLRIKKRLKKFRRRPFFNHQLFNIRNISFRLLNKFFFRKKKLLDPGLLIAICGLDGSGKSSLVLELKKSFSKDFSVKVFHLGRPSSSLLTIFFNFPIRIYSVIRRINPKRDKKNMIDEIKRTSNLQAFRSLLLAYDRSRESLRARKYSQSGYLVVCDRYPGILHGKMDSPRIILDEDRGSFYQFCYEKEKQLYGSIQPADAIFHLSVPFNISIERNNNRVKFGKETEEELRQRFALNENARFLADEYNFIDATLPFREVTTQVSQSIWNLRI